LETFKEKYTDKATAQVKLWMSNEKNGFKALVADDDDKHTRLMYFDIMEM